MDKPDMKMLLLQTALPLFRENGYENVSVMEICKKAGVTRNAFYYHYDSKEALLGSYFEYTTITHTDFLSDLIKLPTDWEKLLYLFEAHVRLFIEEGKVFTRQLMKASLDNATGLLDQYVLTDTLCIPLIEQCKQAGHITSSLAPKDLNYYATRLSMGIVFDWCASKVEFDVVKQVREALTHLFSGDNNDD